MRTVGLIGGMSWRSSALYYRLFNESAATILGGTRNARSVMVTINFEDVLCSGVNGDWNTVAEILSRSATAIQRAGGECIVMASNTAHIVADKISSITPLPILHIVDAVAAALRKHGIERVGLIGTEETINSGLYERISATPRSPSIDLPDSRERSDLQAIIHGELSRGEISLSSRRRCEEIVQRLANAGSHAVILGCTEFSLLDDLRSPIPLFDSTRLHVQQAVAFALRNEDRQCLEPTKV